MSYFENIMDIYQILYFFIIPFVVTFLFYKIKRKLLWITPFISVGLGVALSLIFFPFFLTDILTRNFDFATIYWVIFFVPLQVLSSLISLAVFWMIDKKYSKK